MRVLIVNTSECTGGAAVAANRLTEALNNHGVKAKMLVRDKQTDSITTASLPPSWRLRWNFLWERFVIWWKNGLRRKNLFAVSIANSGTDITRLPEFREADIIHLHWVNQGMLSLKGIRRILASGKPVVWTMHDMWPCTGICHHARECNGFHDACGQCWLLSFPKDKDLSHRVFLKKQQVYAEGRLHMVAVSHWLQQQVQQSALTRDIPSSVIPNTLSLQKFHIREKTKARRQLGLPTDRCIILFGAARIDDPIKGFPTLLKAIGHLLSNGFYKKEELHLAFFGKIKFPDAVLHHIPVEYTDLGWVNDSDTLSAIYSAADTTVCASLYETFGQTLIEAQACGCLPVSFGNSGQADIIRHRENGYLAQAYSVEDLAAGIHWAFTEGKEHISPETMRNEVVHKYAGDVVASQYIQLYEKLK
ncbi:MAG: glycosyltransferase [Bacteroidaceae bacterium]|nr:glycosyltransferase [Bacteroidaceae bacterium]